MIVSYYMNLLSCVKGMCVDVVWLMGLWRDRVMIRGDSTHLLAVRGLCGGVRSCEELWRERVMSRGEITRLLAVRGVREGARSCEELWRNHVMSRGEFTRLLAVRAVCEDVHKCIKMSRKRVTRCKIISAPFWNFLFYASLYRIVEFISQSWHKLCRNVKVPKKRRGEFFSSPRHR